MPKQMFATIQLTLSDDEFEEAQQKVAFKPVWDDLVKAMQAIDPPAAFATKLETVVTRAKPAAATGAKRGRKAKPSTLTIGQLADGQTAGLLGPANPAALV